jgi:diguanylate cyclase (GGDEF)-like protein/PAS domain S-box-containing protein
MPKQYLSIEALRCATIARFLAAGLERSRQRVVSNRAGFSLCMRAIKAAAIAGCIMLAFEAAKQAIHPQMSISTSHALTILFTTLPAGAVTFAALRKGTEAALRQLEIQYRQLFDSNPLPMWVFERKTLKFLEVNEAASRQYGFSNREFMTMTIADIRPEEDIADLLEATEKLIHGLEEPTIWRHRKKNGAIIDVEIVGHDLHWHGIEAQLVAARDVTERRRVQDAMIESEGRYRSLFENMQEGFAYCEMLFDDRGRPEDFVYLAVNSTFGKLTGLDNVVGKRFSEVIPGSKDSHPELVERYGRVVLTGEPERFETEIRVLGLWFSISAYSAGKGCFVAVFDNITERKQTEKALLFKNALLEAQAETTIDGILVVDESDHIVLANKQFGQHFGIPNDLLSTNDDLIVRKHVIDKVEDPGAFIERVNYLNRHRDEKSRDELRFKNGKVFDRYSAPLIDSRSQYRGRIWYFRDITDRKVAEERVQYLAYYDALTGLPNRTLLQDRLEKALSSARRRKDKVALLFLDLDRFKDINDSLGHSVGDLFLQEVGERLRTWGRKQDTVARLGGDEFLIMVTEVENASDAAVAAARLMDTMTAEFVVQGRRLSINCSLGISVFPEHGADGETLIKNADAAMYSAKDNGRNNFCFFTEEMNAQVAERLRLENSLRFALEKEQLYLVYQPQMDIATGGITGMEALLRWQHPDLGLVPPDRFIRIAENTGLIVPIGEWVLRTACRQARKWQDEGLPAVSVAVNVSAVQFRQEGFCELIGRVLRESGLAPRYLELELTESVLLANAEVMLSVIQELKAMGLTLAIDDFGTGYSSFSYLRQFRVNKFKIDRSFIQDVAVNADDAAITAAIIGMAKSLRLKVIAEGVETEAQMSFLRTHQCDEIQGYYFSKPLSAGEGTDKLRSSAVHALSRSQGT